MFDQFTDATECSPFTRFFGAFPMGGRSTAIKLTNGDVWVVASTPLSLETKETVDKMGKVEWVTATLHFAYSEVTDIGIS